MDTIYQTNRLQRILELLRSSTNPTLTTHSLAATLSSRGWATWTTKALRETIPLSRVHSNMPTLETELFARGELQEFECKAMLRSFLLPSDQLPKDLRKFRELPEGGGGLWGEAIYIEPKDAEEYDEDTWFELDYHEELLPTFEFA
jgi:hypothetical protein